MDELVGELLAFVLDNINLINFFIHVQMYQIF